MNDFIHNSATLIAAFAAVSIPVAVSLFLILLAKKKSANDTQQSRLNRGVLLHKTFELASECALKIAEKKVRVGEDWMKINPSMFRVTKVHLSALRDRNEYAERLTIVIAGVKPRAKVPRIIAKLEDSIAGLGVPRADIVVATETHK